MTKKQKLLLIGIATLIMVMIGSTSAFFVTSSRAHNVITTSGVSIELIENTNQSGVDGRPIPFTNIDNARPGEEYSKIPQVKNTDDGDAWIRIAVKKVAEKSDGTMVDVADNLMLTNYNTRNWLDGNDGYYYYYRALKSGETTEPLFTNVKLADNLNSEIKASKYHLSLQAEAVQTANNGNSVYEAEGWPEE